MREYKPSRTAARVALRRAAHQLLDRPPVFGDPLALQIVGRDVGAALREDPRRFDRHLLSSRLRAFLAVRSRVAEERLAEMVAGGTRQYVVLGAGLDTFAYRNAWPDLRVFEVDHPATQHWKRRRLREVGIAEPSSLAFVPVDFERQQLDAELARGGFAIDQPAFFSWLGVVPYLDASAVWTTLRWVAEAARAGGGIAFDYSIPPETVNPVTRALFSLLAARVKSIGEPFRTFFRPRDLTAGLQALGFDRVEDLGPSDLNRRYFAGRKDGLGVGSMGHMAIATRASVSPPTRS